MKTVTMYGQLLYSEMYILFIKVLVLISSAYWSALLYNKVNNKISVAGLTNHFNLLKCQAASTDNSYWHIIDDIKC